MRVTFPNTSLSNIVIFTSFILCQYIPNLIPGPLSPAVMGPPVSLLPSNSIIGLIKMILQIYHRRISTNSHVQGLEILESLRRQRSGAGVEAASVRVSRPVQAQRSVDPREDQPPGNSVSQTVSCGIMLIRERIQNLYDVSSKFFFGEAVKKTAKLWT